jgi:hypothetical protein
MGEVKEKVEEQKKAEQPTYEELKNYCNQLMMQRNQIANQLNQVTNVVNKLPWLFEVVKNQSSFNPTFVKFCVKEIEAIMTPPPAEENKDTDKE